MYPIITSNASCNDFQSQFLRKNYMLQVGPKSPINLKNYWDGRPYDLFEVKEIGIYILD